MIQGYVRPKQRITNRLSDFKFTETIVTLTGLPGSKLFPAYRLLRGRFPKGARIADIAGMDNKPYLVIIKLLDELGRAVDIKTIRLQMPDNNFGLAVQMQRR